MSYPIDLTDRDSLLKSANTSLNSKVFSLFSSFYFFPSLISLSSSFTFRALIAGGGAPEIEVSQKLMQFGKTLKGSQAYCVQAFAEALEVLSTHDLNKHENTLKKKKKRSFLTLLPKTLD